MSLEYEYGVIYHAPTKGRRYLTARAAAKNEAGALLERKYPTERGDESDGFYNWHWSSDEHLVRVHKRLTRLLLRQLRKSNG